MKVFIIGGCNTVVNALLQKFNKEGLKLYVLTGSHQYHNKYKHVYEQYHFSYENNCIKEVFESVHPDVTILPVPLTATITGKTDFVKLHLIAAGCITF